MIVDNATPLDDPTPELARLRTALIIDWDSYRAWVDRNYQAINKLVEEIEADAEKSDPIIHAHYVFERSMVPYAPVVQPEAVESAQAQRDIAKTRSVVGWVHAVLIDALALTALALAAAGCGMPL